jgi:hypothetical protein
MRQRRWLELIKDYELEVHYHPVIPNLSLFITLTPTLRS